MYASHVDLTQPLSFTIDDVLSAGECADTIRIIEALRPRVAPISRASGPVVDLGTRNNTRVMFDNPTFAADLFRRVRGRVPSRLSGMEVAGANERLRCYKYEPSQRFAPHYDGSFFRDEREWSLLTLLVYLNDDFAGGETNLLDLDETVKPKTGMALLFQHRILHEGAAVTAGVKYVVRSDVMYRKS